MPKTWLPAVDTRVRVEKKLTVGERTLYPLVRISIIRTELGGIHAAWLKPLAMLVIEQKKPYVISLSPEKLTLEEILELVPSLKAVLEKEEGIVRIRID